MIHNRTGQSLLLLALVAMGLSSVIGCNRGPATAQVEGKVVFKNGSMPKAAIRAVRFEPTKESMAEIRKPAGADIRDDGSFALFTRKPGDGVYLGEYAVTFAFSKSSREQIPLIAKKYEAADTTPYKVKVDRDVSDLVFELEPLEAAVK